ncbi:hypothetical protein [Microcoleus sp. FACHB-1515]|nr:hypothetical protein [Microcoleus sp. FACHB-1515]
MKIFFKRWPFVQPQILPVGTSRNRGDRLNPAIPFLSRPGNR